MSIEVKFESPPDNILVTRNFQPGQSLRIGGHVTGAAGLGEPFTPVVLDITDGFYPITAQSSTNWLGDFWFDVALPNVTSQATVKLTATFSVMGQDVVTIPIGIGEVMPAPLPTPPKQVGETALEVIKWVAIGAAILGIVYLITTTGILTSGRQLRKYNR